MNHIKIRRARRTGTITRCMAEIMQEHIADQASVTEAQLLDEGFSPEEIAVHSAKAKVLCATLIDRQVERTARA